jgi:hypothetical protein
MCQNPSVAHESWDADEWEKYGVKLVTHHFGVDQVIRVPDLDGGDRGLDAYTRGGMGFQCYAPENEPLAPSNRARLQKKKINTDLKKLRDKKDQLITLLGTTKLNSWVLLTPANESADLIGYCNTKAAEVIGWELPFVGEGFCVLVHDLETYAAAHAVLATAAVMASDLQRPPPPPPGINFELAAGSHIDVMDGKLAKIPTLSNDVARTKHRAALLAGQFGGDALLDRYRDRMPEIASNFESQIEAAQREMILSSADGSVPAEFYSQLRSRLVERFSSLLNQTNAEYLAQKCVADWLQQCPLNFESAG